MRDFKILVVDDEEVIRNLCCQILVKESYRVKTAENGIKALAKLNKDDYDIVLVDLKMPIMGGMELLEAVKRDLPHLEVIIMTGFATIENAIEAMRKGAYDFVLKPFNTDQIRLVVKRCVDKIKLSKENKELKLVNQKLKEIQEMKDKFIAITSHELRTPVSHIKGYLNILTDELDTSFTEADRKEFLEIINSAVEDLEHIVTDMYNILQIDNGGLQLEKEAFDVNSVVEQLAEEFKMTLKSRSQILKIKKSDSLPPIQGDRMKVKQMVSELIQNAIKYTPDGGEIDISTDSDEEFCKITVVDTGIGIQDAEKGKIFEKFYEVQNTDYHSSSKTQFMGGGLGLGLSIAKAIAEAHGGGIRVASVPNHGSQFTVYLPLSNAN